MENDTPDSVENKQAVLLAIVQLWNISEHPEYRGFRCAYCKKYMANGAWHHLLNMGGYITQVHFCNMCEAAFNHSQLKTHKPKTIIDKSYVRSAFKQSTLNTLRRILALREASATDIYKAFICDFCGNELPIDEEYRKGYHLWSKIDEILAEFHFDRQCFHELFD